MVRQSIHRAVRRIASFARGLIRPGWRNTLYRAEARVRGLDLTRHVSTEDLGIAPNRGSPYGNSGGPDLARVLQALRPEPSSAIIDLGCGKGGALITMASFPFARICGVDLSADLLRVASENLRKCGLEGIELHCCDAADFADLDGFTHVYMYNPFPSPVMQAVMANLRASLTRRPRSLTIIYKNPVCHEDVIGALEFAEVRTFTHSSHPFVVYQYRCS